MPYEIEILSERRLGIIRLSGYVDAAQLDAAADEQAKHGAFESSYNSLWDLRHTTAVDVSPEGMSKLIEQKLKRDAEMGLTGKIAIVVNRHTVAGAALLAKVRANRVPGRTVDVFPTERLAFEWLDGAD